MPDPAVTSLLDRFQAGDRGATEALLPIVYDELRRLAAGRLARERFAHTLQPTALVHEVYLRLVGGTHPERQWDHRGHFFAAAAEAMRRILVEEARRKKRLKHANGSSREPLSVSCLPSRRALDVDQLLSLDEALTAFSHDSPEKAELVKLRYFAGFSEQEAAQILGISRPTAARWWAYAKAWIFERLRGNEDLRN